MSKKDLNQNAIFVQELISSIEPNFTFNNKPLNRFEITKNTSDSTNSNKLELLLELKKEINSIENCNLKNNSKSLVLGDGNINSPIMVIGEAPGKLEDKLGLCFQGSVGTLLNKMFAAINIQRDKIYLTYSINYRPPEDRKPTTQ